MDTAEEQNKWIRAGERLDDLHCNGWKILQRPDGFCFGMDAVLLAAFAAEKIAAKAVDLGTGTGVIPLLVSSRLPNVQFDAVEIQTEIADMAQRTMKQCGMTQRIAVHAMDLRDAPARLGREKYDLVVCNPPYGKAGASLINPLEERRTARHEGDAGIREIADTAFQLLRNGGRLCVVFPVQRFIELIDALRAVKIEPKRVQFIHPSAAKAPNLLLLEGMKAAKPGLHFMPPLIVQDAEGNETAQLRSMYRE